MKSRRLLTLFQHLRWRLLTVASDTWRKKKPKQAVKLTTHNFYVNMSCSGREIFIRDFHYSLGILFNIFERGQFRETAGNERRARSTFLNWIICSSGRCQSAVVANELITAFLEQNQTFVAFCAFFLFPLFPVCLFFNLNWSDKRKKNGAHAFVQSNPVFMINSKWLYGSQLRS